MPRTLAGRIFAVGLLLAIGVGVWLGRYYGGSYSIRLHAPNESWLHDLPWEYRNLHGDAAGDIADSVFLASGAAEIVVLIRSIPPFTSTDREPFERGFQDAIREKSGRQPVRCEPVETGEDNWHCVEWTVVVERVSLRQRAYLSGRGITRAIVVFTAPADRFSVFGAPERWLEGLEWKGPGVAHAI